jgi:hypothetical protein
MLILKYIKDVLKVKYCERNKENNLHISAMQMALTINLNYQKVVKICQNNP